MRGGGAHRSKEEGLAREEVQEKGECPFLQQGQGGVRLGTVEILVVRFKGGPRRWTGTARHVLPRLQLEETPPAPDLAEQALGGCTGRTRSSTSPSGKTPVKPAPFKYLRKDRSSATHGPDSILLLVPGLFFLPLGLGPG